MTEPCNERLKWPTKTSRYLLQRRDTIHTIAEYVTCHDRTDVLTHRDLLAWPRTWCDREWWSEMRYPRAARYSITPVTRVTVERAAPGSHGNIPDNCEYFNINISPRISRQLNIITRRHTSVSIQYSVCTAQTRVGVGKCPNNAWLFIMQWKSIDERLVSCVTLWDQEQSHDDPLLILIHVLIASSIAPLYSLASPTEPNET